MLNNSFLRLMVLYDPLVGCKTIKYQNVYGEHSTVSINNHFIFRLKDRSSSRGNDVLSMSVIVVFASQHWLLSLWGPCVYREIWDSLKVKRYYFKKAKKKKAPIKAGPQPKCDMWFVKKQNKVMHMFIWRFFFSCSTYKLIVLFFFFFLFY